MPETKKESAIKKARRISAYVIETRHDAVSMSLYEQIVKLYEQAYREDAGD